MKGNASMSVPLHYFIESFAFLQHVPDSILRQHASSQILRQFPFLIRFAILFPLLAAQILVQLFDSLPSLIILL